MIKPNNKVKNLKESKGIFGVRKRSFSVFILLSTFYFLLSTSSAFGAALQNYNLGASGATNFEVGEAVWTGNVFQLQTRAGGTGVLRAVQMTVGTNAGIYINTSGNTSIATTTFPYSSSDNAGVTGNPSTNVVSVAGSVQLIGNSDAIVFGRGTSSFLKDEELAFGWGGGWYMTDGTYLRVRGNKTLYSTGGAEFGQPIVVGTPTGATHAATKNYVDSVVGGGAGSGSFATLSVTGNSYLATTSGNVGIGTTGPDSSLHIIGPSQTTAFHTAHAWDGGADAQTMVKLETTRTSNGGTSPQIFFKDNYTGGYNWKIGGDDTGIDFSILKAPVGTFPNTYVMKFQGSTGNVGIGTTAPNSTLQIGSVGATGYAGNELAIGDGTRAFALDIDINGANLYSSTNLILSPGTSEKVRITSAGNVGIGSTVPAYKLDVAGTAQFTQPVIVGTPTAAGHATTKSYVDSATVGQTGWTDGGTSVYNTTLTDNVGIGTMTPTHKLDIVGTVRTSTGTAISYGAGEDYIIWNDELAYSIVDDATDANYKTMKTFVASKSGSFKFKFSAYIQSGTYYWAWRVLKNSATVVASGHYNSGLDTGEVTSVHEYRRFVGTISDIEAGDSFALQMVSSDGSGNPTSGNGQTLYAKEFRTYSTTPSIEHGGLANIWGGYVGIGTTAPATKLHIYNNLTGVNELLRLENKYGTVGDGGLLRFTNQHSAGTNPNAGEYNLAGIKAYDYDNNWGGALDFQTPNSGVAGGGNLITRMTIAAGGNVGIGSTVPAYKLDVAGTGQFTQPVLVGTPTAAGHATTKSYVDSATVGQTGWTDGGTSVYNTTLTDNVGIGTTSPASLLHLVKDNYPEFRIQNTNVTYPSNFSVLAGGGYGDNRSLVIQDNTAGQARITLNNGGSVGIGSTTPGEKLDVSGTIRASSYVQAANFRDATGTYNVNLGSGGSEGRGLVAGYSGGSYGGIGYNVRHTTTGGQYIAPLSDTVSYLLFTGGGFRFQGSPAGTAGRTLSSWNELMTIAAGGNIGIGSTSPAYKLDVAGTAQFTQPVIVGTPTATNHATTKSYVDSALSGGAIPIKKATSAAVNFSTQSVIVADLGGYDDARRHAGIIKISVSNGPSGNSLGSAIYEILPEFNQGLQTGWILRALDATYFSAKKQLGHILKLYSAAYTNSEPIYLVYEGNTLVPNENSYYVTIEWFGIQSDKNLMMEVINKTTDARVTGAGAARVVTATDRYDDRYGTAAIGWTKSGSYIYATNVGDSVGIGTTTPGAKLDVSGSVSAVMYYDRDNTNYYIDPAKNLMPYAMILNGAIGVKNTSPAYDIDVTGTLRATGNWSLGGAAQTNLNMNNLQISGVSKLDVGTIDPLYEIAGGKYATYASSIAGGVKEEYVGRARLTRSIKNKVVNSKYDEEDTQYLIPNTEYSYVIDFSEIEKGSDLWVWRKTVDFSRDNVEVMATAYGVPVPISYEIDGNKIIFRSEILNTRYKILDTGLEFSYRLVGKRFDWKNWPTFATDQTKRPNLIVK